VRLGRVHSLLQKMQPGDDRDDRLREFALNAALLSGLTDNPELGRRMVEAVLRKDPDDTAAREILTALQ
jgi:hypothetical protein